MPLMIKITYMRPSPLRLISILARSSAFYGTKCEGLNYDQADSNNCLTMNKRDYDSRRQRLLGYYSTEDTVNVVELDPVRLRYDHQSSEQ